MWSQIRFDLECDVAAGRYCCTTAAAGGDCAHNNGGGFENPTDAEMTDMGWVKDGAGVWQHPDYPAVYQGGVDRHGSPEPLIDDDEEYEDDLPF